MPLPLSLTLPETPLHASAALYVLATPLGNRFDLSLRALAVLQAVDCVACEDTRHSQRLFESFNLSLRCLALHQHNEQAAASAVIERLQAGQHVALVSDAGTPAVSDPGAKLVARVQAAGFPVVPIPGACAAITALSASGLVTDTFQFIGFLPPKTAARRTQIASLRAYQGALMFYEAPHRICECVADLLAVLEPEREIVFARELTKLFEQIARMPLAEASEWLAADANRQRGEFVLLIGPPPPHEGLPLEAQRTLQLLLNELPLKTAARLAAELTGAPKNALYDYGLSLKT